MSENPLVSAIVTTYKRPVEIVERALQSIVAQEYENLEIILVNDAPEDNVLAGNLKKMTSTLSKKVKYIEMKHNSGACAARNRGIKESLGEFVAFLDDDDEWKPQKHTVKVIHKQNAGVVAGWMDGVNAAEGEYVGFVDSDDYIDGNMYEKLWEAVEKCKVDISMCNHLYEKNGVKIPCKELIAEGVYAGTQMKQVRELILPKLAEPYLSPSLCNKIFRKKLFKQNLFL